MVKDKKNYSRWGNIDFTKDAPAFTRHPQGEHGSDSVRNTLRFFSTRGRLCCAPVTVLFIPATFITLTLTNKKKLRMCLVLR